MEVQNEMSTTCNYFEIKSMGRTTSVNLMRNPQYSSALKRSRRLTYVKALTTWRPRSATTSNDIFTTSYIKLTSSYPHYHAVPWGRPHTTLLILGILPSSRYSIPFLFKKIKILHQLIICLSYFSQESWPHH